MTRALFTLLLCTLLGACAQYENRRGVDVNWSPAQLGDITVGKTTRSEVLKRLGPPSQLIALEDETVLYYLFEHAQGEGLILVVYNRFEVNTRYDRAVFIFDEQDQLVDYSTYVQQDD
ncbi:hypothetical protein FV139_01345 [Parahaliea maris]|uniref:Lipoprotein SmpA/OmlA domain-containing protein n=1 Tax=Parahaliea maris TaxID=2716870 RepID=A0A5C9A7T8_9GAMM|nr:hypothetical protein [Parahaliea maris]TXS96179.1 hypothetical protein FV139_01345 [Parahaliea maris]